MRDFEALKTVSNEFLKNSFSFSRYRLLKSKNSAGQILGFHRFPRKYCRAISVCDVTDDLCSELEADVHTEPRSLFPRSRAPREFILKIFKGELQRENKLISYERAFKMLENDMYIAGIGQAILELLSFKVGSGNHQRGISLLQKFSDIFGNMRLVPLKITSHLTSHNFQILKIEIFSKPCKI